MATVMSRVGTDDGHDQDKFHSSSGDREVFGTIPRKCYQGKVRFLLTSVVGTNSDPSDEIHLWILIFLTSVSPGYPRYPS
jgi:hypothetical protein